LNKRRTGPFDFEARVLVLRVVPGLSARAIRGGVKGNNEAKQLALELLITENAVRVEKSGSSNRHYSVQPFRLTRAQANTCDQDHGYTDEQKAFNNGEMNQLGNVVGMPGYKDCKKPAEIAANSPALAVPAEAIKKFFKAGVPDAAAVRVRIESIRSP